MASYPSYLVCSHTASFVISAAIAPFGRANAVRHYPFAILSDNLFEIAIYMKINECYTK